MTKLRRKDASKELSALARLSDRDIDTSDIPEIKDWSRAIQAKFYRCEVQRSIPITRVSMSSIANSRILSVGLGGTHVQSTATTTITKMTTGAVVEACLEGTREAWSEFIRRFHGLIANVVLRAARRWSAPSADLVEDLTQDVYLRLMANDCRLLRAYQGRHENSFLAYLKVVAANVVHDYFRGVYAGERTSGSDDQVLLGADDAFSLVAPEKALLSQERAVFFEEIDRILTARASEKEKSVFWLHYRHGLTASEIAAIPEINLSIKGVESLLHRLRSHMRSELMKHYRKRYSP